MKNSKIVLCKLDCGVEFMGEIVEETETGVVFKDPLEILYRPTSLISPAAIGLTRFMTLAKKNTLPISKADIICCVEPMDEAKAYYIATLNYTKETHDVTLVNALRSAIGVSVDTPGESLSESDVENLQKQLLSSLDPNDFTKQ